MIRAFHQDDWPAVWALLEPVFREGRTYAVPRDITEGEARVLWTGAPRTTWVATDTHGILGTYYLKPNQSGPGGHIANCGYVVAERARGMGVASAMCEHSQELAASLGFRGMQFNLVVSTNTGAIRLWERHGFEIVGTIPGAFEHPELGFVDAHVMFKTLETNAQG